MHQHFIKELRSKFVRERLFKIRVSFTTSYVMDVYTSNCFLLPENVKKLNENKFKKHGRRESNLTLTSLMVGYRDGTAHS